MSRNLNARAPRSGGHEGAALAALLLLAAFGVHAAGPGSAAAPALPAMDLPPGPIYVCDVGGARTPVEYPGSVEQLCRRHPEMGPCQYERNACRKRGGRVYTSRGDEVTPAIETIYDQRVQRVKLP
jgi:hypothetical protein